MQRVRNIVRRSSQQEFEREHNKIAVRRVRARTPHGSSSGKYKEGTVSSLSGQGGSNNIRLVKRTASRRVLHVRYLGWDARARWTSVRHPNGAVKGRALGNGWQYGFVILKPYSGIVVTHNRFCRLGQRRLRRIWSPVRERESYLRRQSDNVECLL